MGILKTAATATVIVVPEIVTYPTTAVLGIIAVSKIMTGSVTTMPVIAIIRILVPTHPDNRITDRIMRDTGWTISII